MRYLVENNDYEILYGRMLFVSTLDMGTICAKLTDKHTGEQIQDNEDYYNGNLEPCLMKLGKRMIKKWRSQRKLLS